jgi:transcriptional regulator with XRE-family HTH domain
MPAASKRSAKPAARAKPAPPAVDEAEAEAVGPEAGLGRALAVRRAELGLTRKAVAARAALSYPYVAELERGRKAPSAAALTAIAAALEVTPSELLARAEQLAAAARLRAAGSGAVPAVTSGQGSAGAHEDNDLADRADLTALVRDIVRAELTTTHTEHGRRDEAVPAATGAVGDASESAAGAAAISTAALRDAVLIAMRQMLDNPEIDFDSEGDIPIRRHDVMLFVRVLEDPLSVLVFSPMIVGIDESAALLERINDLNANIHFVRFCLTHGGVVADIELFADPFDPALVIAACRTLTQTAEAVGPDLQNEYGGRLFFGDEHEPKPRPGTGGYL